MQTSVEDKIKKFADDVISNAQRELGATKTRNSYRAKWKNGKLQSFTIKKVKRRADATGALRNSLDYSIKESGKGFTINFTGLDYGIYVEEGRLPGRGIPVNALQRWIKAKRIRPQKEGGGFIKGTPAAVKSLGFLINRKIKTFGIEANPFMQPSIERYKKNFLDDLGKGYAEDIANEIRNNWT